jgi:hemolysin activation/secretion protein
MRLSTLLLTAACAAATALPAAAQSEPLTQNDPTAALPPPPETSAPLDTNRPQAEDGSSQTVNGLVFRAARFTGAAAVPEAALAPAWEAYVGREVSYADLRAIARKVEDIYRRRGYPFVAVVAPAQDISDGTVTFAVVEGRISDLTVVGDDPVARRQASTAFQPLLDREPLAGEDLQRAYELARTTPGLSIAGALRRGSKPGGMDLVVQTRRRDWRAYVNVNNLFSEPVGPWGALVGADFFGESAYGDVTSVQAYSTFDWDEQQVLRLNHSRRLNARGLTLTASYLWANANPQGVVAPLDLATDVQAGRVELSYPLVLRPSLSLWAAGAFDYSDQKTDVFSSIPITDDRTRELSLQLSGEWKPREDRIAHFAFEVRQGVDVFDASERGQPLASRPEGDPQATYLRFSADGEMAITPRWKVYGRFEGQAADTPLLAPDEYSVGNLSIGRGYDPGSALGDSAAAITLEARWGPFPFAEGRFRYAPFVFFDGVRYWNEDSTGVRERTISSAGVGLRLDMPGHGRLDFTWAKPLNEPLGIGEKTPGSRLLINFTATFDDLAEDLWSRARKGMSR